ncbi:MAG: GIY-YIG nuclease family protein [Candidatus Staskawiczbacteria bacterium]|nr:GIY-YIG nuclease family protein [Candidatus Staskawiczbacteria bacterium]
MFYTYILKSLNNGSYYAGSCEDFNARFKLHNTGQVKSTRKYVPWEMMYKEEYKTLSEAMKRETQIKSWHKRSAIEKLFKI